MDIPGCTSQTLKICREASYLHVAPGHVLQHPDPMGPGVVVTGVATSGVAAHLHLLVEHPGQMFAELLAPLSVGRLCLALLLLLLLGSAAATAPSRALTQDLLQHPTSTGRQELLC